MSPTSAPPRRRRRQASVKSFFAPVERTPRPASPYPTRASAPAPDGTPVPALTLASESTASAGLETEILPTETLVVQSVSAHASVTKPCPTALKESGSSTPTLSPNADHAPARAAIEVASATLNCEPAAVASKASPTPRRSPSSSIPSPPSEPETEATVLRGARSTLSVVHLASASMAIAPHSRATYTLVTPFSAISLPELVVPDMPSDSAGSSSAIVLDVAPNSGDKDATAPPNRKRRRAAANVERRERPRTRASLRSARSKSPPIPASCAAVTVDVSATKSADACPVSPVSHTPPSRLNRARNVARRTATKVQVSHASDVEEDSAACATDVIVVVDEDLTSPEKQGTRQTEIAAASLTPVTAPSSSSASPSAAASPSTSHTGIHNVTKKRSLHPFFSATVVAVSSARDKNKAPRLERPVCDAWSCPSATVHVNQGAPQPAQSAVITNVPSAPPRKIEGKRCATVVDMLPAVNAKFSYYPSQFVPPSPSIMSIPLRSTLTSIASGHSDVWADLYRTDHRIDIINAPAIDELTDWLRSWYEKRRGSSDDSDEEMSILAELEDNDSNERERIAIITGPIGCGKSTIVGTAARRLGLSVLEINASVCRTGRRVRDIVGEALRTHRVTHGKTATGGSGCLFRQPQNGRNSSSDGRAKSLILFEEVDELQPEEKGFWSSVQELATSDDCRRPIVCTANSFTTSMRQIFMEQKASATRDFDRLVINTKVERLQLETPYRLIAFGDARSDRQATSVLQRIAHTESVSMERPLQECLTLLHRSDIRRAINELQFWGTRGLEPNFKADVYNAADEKLVSVPQLRVGVEMVISNAESDASWALFAVSSDAFCNEQRNIRPKQTQLDTADTLGVWASSLEAMSAADTILSSRCRQMALRSADNRLSPDAVCLDADLLQSVYVEEDILSESLHFARHHLSQSRDSPRLRDLAMYMSNNQHSQIISLLPPAVPLARRPMLVEYLPMLISLVLAEEQAKQRGDPKTEEPKRRTRSRTKRSGLRALGLDNATILLLKKASIAP